VNDVAETDTFVTDYWCGFGFLFVADNIKSDMFICYECLGIRLLCV
jgi:hypothetical protein